MSPQQDGRRKGANHPKPTWVTWTTEEDEDSFPSATSITSIPDDLSMGDYPPMPTEIPVEETSFDYGTAFTRTPQNLPWSSELYPDTPWPGRPSPTPASAWTFSTVTKQTPDLENWNTATSSGTPTLVASYERSSPSATASGAYGNRGPGPWTKNHANNGPMYAVAAIIPVVVLAIIGCIFFVCLRKRKRARRHAAEAKAASQEMKMRTQHTAQPYMAPRASLPQYHAVVSQMPPTSTPSQMQPVILGPISSSSNGAYLTGLDTSDVVSVTSDNLRPVDPFADNSSLAEPPPPYRPRSVAPPSFVSTSRQSSVRTSAPPPTTSRTHLIERSPFDDPQDDEAVSELSGPTVGRGEDTLSIVSDLSYQRDPVVGRPS